MERLYITGPMSRALRRLARRGLGIRLEPLHSVAITSPSSGYVTRASLGLDGLCQALGYGADKPIEVLVPRAGKRIWAKGIRCHVCSVELPPHSFELVLPGKGNPMNLPSDLQVLVESPQLAFARAAQQLGKAMSSDGVGAVDGRLRLLKLGVEDCGTYSLDPWNPLSGACGFELSPCMTVSGLRQYLQELHRFDGIALAREVAEWAFDLSASPMETLVNAAVSLPVCMGSLSLGNPVANKTIPLNAMQRLMLNHIDHITPDLLWESVAIVLEYLGGDAHEGPRAQCEDVGRIQDYQTLGYLVFPVLYAHVRNPGQFNRLAMRIATAMEQRGEQGMLAWVEELLADDDFLARQRELFALMLPAVRDR